MWLLENNAVLTKDNLLRRNWVGSPSCYFCQNNESIDHLFFMCPVAKVIWGMVGLCIGATNIPNNLSQAKIWFVHWLPGGEQIYTFCMAAICWAIWKKRNEACFDNKQLRNWYRILCLCFNDIMGRFVWCRNARQDPGWCEASSVMCQQDDDQPAALISTTSTTP